MTIKQERGYLGPFLCTLKPGNTQHFVLQPGDDGPFWMTVEERKNMRHDKDEAHTHTKSS